MKIKIYHNPACGTSRNVLQILQEAGKNPEVIEYLKNPPTRAEIKEIVRKSGGSLRELLREKGTPYNELGFNNSEISDDEILDFIEEHPILLNRPIVVTDKTAKLCRPSESVREII